MGEFGHQLMVSSVSVIAHARDSTEFRHHFDNSLHITYLYMVIYQFNFHMVILQIYNLKEINLSMLK